MNDRTTTHDTAATDVLSKAEIRAINDCIKRKNVDMKRHENLHGGAKRGLSPVKSSLPPTSSALSFSPPRIPAVNLAGSADGSFFGGIGGGLAVCGFGVRIEDRKVTT